METQATKHEKTLSEANNIPRSSPGEACLETAAVLHTSVPAYWALYTRHRPHSPWKAAPGAPGTSRSCSEGPAQGAVLARSLAIPEEGQGPDASYLQHSRIQDNAT